MMLMRLAGLAIAICLLSVVLPISAHGLGGDLISSGCRPVKRSSTNPALRQRQLGSVSGEGADVANTGGASAAGYSCDPNTCRLPNCHCADTKPPGNLELSDVPQFITLTADDAIQSYTLDALGALTKGRKNPNGCSVSATYFTSLDYTNYSLVTDFYVAGNEIADHTMTHVGQPPLNEVAGNLISLNALAGLPFKELVGFRAPFLNYTVQNLVDLAKMNFTYDSSSTSGVPVTDPNTDAFWPYTLDNGLANDCQVDGLTGVCHGQPKLPGLWEIPMYSTFNPDKTILGLMDPWLEVSQDNVQAALRATFNDHYHAQKQPFGLYSHPIHISTTYPGAPVPGNQRMIDNLNTFLDYAMASGQFQNVWMVSNKQLLAWMRNPVPASQLNTLREFQCQAPNPPQAQICSGIPDREATLLNHCISDTAGDSLNNSPFYTCYGCPVARPTPDQPNPPQHNNDGSMRSRVSSTCDTPFWDPVAGKCLNSGYQDTTRPIGPNGANLTSTGTSNGLNISHGDGSKDDPFKTFGGKNAAFSFKRDSSSCLSAAIAIVTTLMVAMVLL